MDDDSAVIRFWELLQPAERAVLDAAGTRSEFDAGEVICQEGEPTQHVLIVLRGLVRVTANSPGGHEKVLAVRGPGDIIGERSAIDGLPRSATVRAMNPVRALIIPPERFTSVCQRYPHLAWAMLVVVVARQRDADRQRVEITGTATQRIAAVLLDFALHRGVGSEGEIALSQEELAGIAGTSRESLVRVLRSLRAQGIVRTGRKRIEIIEVDRLFELAG